MRKRGWVGVVFVAAGGLFGRSTVEWAWQRSLDFLSGEAVNGVTFATLPWANMAAVTLVLAGAFMLAWPSPKVAKVDPLAGLVDRAQMILDRIRYVWQPPWLQRYPEPLVDIIRDGASLLVSFENAGFAVPPFVGDDTRQVLAGMEQYFGSMIPLIRDRHIELARQHSVQASKSSLMVEAKNYDKS